MSEFMIIDKEIYNMSQIIKVSKSDMSHYRIDIYYLGFEHTIEFTTQNERNIEFDRIVKHLMKDIK
ncbi:MAG TPA: hypothetical protein VMV32_03580 [Ignavibacteriaceae bacterium]|nr:hypothetical protein [Ignavibacteriaceae bacterium]